MKKLKLPRVDWRSNRLIFSSLPKDIVDYMVVKREARERLFRRKK